jgi:hypothetical protein
VNLGRPPSKEHPLWFLWAIDAKYLSPWVLHGESMLYMWDVLMERQPRTLLELGAGWSSLMLGKYAQFVEQRTGHRVSVSSVEHQLEWAQGAERLLRMHDLDRYVEVMVCPLMQDREDGHVYDLACLGRSRFEFVLIDGPPVAVGRLGTLPMVFPHVASRCIVFLDDAQRTAEADAIVAWRSRFEPTLVFRGFVAVGNGLGCFERMSVRG